MKRVEIGYTAIMNELEKLNIRLEKAQKALEKKTAAAAKLGVADMTMEQHYNWMQAIRENGGFASNAEASKKEEAWFEMMLARDRVTEIEGLIKNAEKRLDKAEQKVEEYRREVEAVADLKSKEELQKLEFEQEQKEWAKDGITLNGRYYGITPGGRKFWIEGNNGYTLRSRHCVTLTLTDEQGKAHCVFTSGEFWRAYAVVKNN